jgi:hypothetical protein
MNKPLSRVLFEDRHYVVCLTRAGISSQDKTTGKGKVMPPSHQHYKGYLEGFEGDGDEHEKHVLAKFLYRS